MYYAWHHLKTTACQRCMLWLQTQQRLAGCAEVRQDSRCKWDNYVTQQLLLWLPSGKVGVKTNQHPANNHLPQHTKPSSTQQRELAGFMQQPDAQWHCSWQWPAVFLRNICSTEPLLMMTKRNIGKATPGTLQAQSRKAAALFTPSHNRRYT